MKTIRSTRLSQAVRAAMLRLNARDIPNPDHREAIYKRHGVSERLSVAETQADGGVLAVNLYHHEHQGAFAEGELQNFEQLAVGLLAGEPRTSISCTFGRLNVG